MGWAEFELRHYIEAVRLLEEALASTVKPLDQKQRAEAEQVLDRARGFVGTVQITTDPPTAAVLVDGAVVELADKPAGLVLEVGDHAFEFHADGRLPTKRTVTVKGGETQALNITLRPVVDNAAIAEAAKPAVEVQPLQSPQKERVDKPLYKKWWVWTLTGVAVAAAAITTAVLLSRDTTKGEHAQTTSNTPPGFTFEAVRSGAP